MFDGIKEHWVFKGTSLNITHARWIKRGKLTKALLQIEITSTWLPQETAQEAAGKHQSEYFRDCSLLQHYDRNK